MDISASECSSGRESGWTAYLNHSSVSADQHHGGRFQEDEKEEEEEDLSMVSDASSGPPNYNEYDENGCNCPVSSASGLSKSKKKKKNIQQNGRKQQYSYLDDTASSLVLSFSKKKASMEMENILDTSKTFSATNVKGKSAFQKHFGLWKSSLAENPNAK